MVVMVMVVVLWVFCGDLGVDSLSEWLIASLIFHLSVTAELPNEIPRKMGHWKTFHKDEVE